jgi:murein DD-endopeptidase MepM/ murein hydrolase activator NlpD
VYAGDDLPGYGLLVLVQHEGGWVTAYARAGSLSVREGDQVRRGQSLGVIGRVGSGPPRLHFQVRQAGAARDPLGVLPRV